MIGLVSRSQPKKRQPKHRFCPPPKRESVLSCWQSTAGPGAAYHHQDHTIILQYTTAQLPSSSAAKYASPTRMEKPLITYSSLPCQSPPITVRYPPPPPFLHQGSEKQRKFGCVDLAALSSNPSILRRTEPERKQKSQSRHVLGSVALQVGTAPLGQPCGLPFACTIFPPLVPLSIWPLHHISFTFSFRKPRSDPQLSDAKPSPDPAERSSPPRNFAHLFHSKQELPPYRVLILCIRTVSLGCFFISSPLEETGSTVQTFLRY